MAASPEGELENLQHEVSALRAELAAERRLRRLIAESHAAVNSVGGGGATVDAAAVNLRVAALEAELRLIRFSRPYRIGQAVRHAMLALRGSIPTARRAFRRRLAPAPAERSSGPHLPQGRGRPIVFFVPWLTYGGGGDQFVRDLAQAFVEEGRSVAVVVTAPSPTELVDATAAMRAVTPHVFDTLAALPIEERLPYVEALVRGLEAPVIFNVGSTWLYGHVAEVRAAAGPGVTVIDQLFNHVGHVANNVAAGGAIDLTVTAHDGLRRLLVEHFRLERPVVTIHVGLRPIDSRSARSRGARPAVAWLGRLSAEKRPQWFVELARALDGEASFVLAGTGPDDVAVRRSAAGIASLEVRGFVEDGVAFLADADLVVLTSEVEGISVVAMEAIALGIPVVSTDVGGMADLIRPAINGELVDPDDHAALVETVRGLVDDRARLDALQERVERDRLPADFTVDEMVARFAELVR